MPFMLAKKIKGLYAITPNKNLDIDLIAGLILKHRINIVQYRNKIANKQLKLDEAKKLRQLCFKYNTLFIINDDINLCQTIGADGVHLGQNDQSAPKARLQLGKDAIIGISCYNKIDLAIKAQNDGANYVAFGALFKSSTKQNACHCPLSVIEQAKNTLKIPIVGIGGITFSNKNQAFDAGCDAVAMLNELFG